MACDDGFLRIRMDSTSATKQFAGGEESFEGLSMNQWFNVNVTLAIAPASVLLQASGEIRDPLMSYAGKGIGRWVSFNFSRSISAS
jgi:hypothetical protein